MPLVKPNKKWIVCIRRHFAEDTVAELFGKVTTDLLGTCCVFQSQWGILGCEPMCECFLLLYSFLSTPSHILLSNVGFHFNKTSRQSEALYVLTAAKNWKNPTRGNNFVWSVQLLQYSFMTATCEHKLVLKCTQHTPSVLCECKTAGMKCCWKNRAAIAWHMQRSGDSVSEGGRKEETGER